MHCRSGNYFLTRDADFALSTIREIHGLRLKKLITSEPQSSSSVIREQDLHLALLRASVGTSAETDKAIEKLRFKLERSPIRPLLTNLSPQKSKRPVPEQDDQTELYGETGSTTDLFSSFLLGSPMVLETSISWPLDLFMTPPAQQTYSEIHSYFFALRDTHLRVLDCWTSLSAAQRLRRKWTGVNEGGTAHEIQQRQKLARSAWGTVRIMLFFLDQLISHFMTDIIEVQHARLLDTLEGVTCNRGVLSTPGSLRGSTRSVAKLGTSPTRSYHHVGPQTNNGTPISPQGGTQSVRSKRRPTAPGTEQSYLDFLSLRSVTIFFDTLPQLTCAAELCTPDISHSFDKGFF